MHELHTSKHKSHIWDGFHRAPDAAACQPCSGDGGGGGGGGGGEGEGGGGRGSRGRDFALLDNGDEAEAETEVDSLADAAEDASSTSSYVARRHRRARGGGGGQTAFTSPSPALTEVAQSLTEIALKAGRGRRCPCSHVIGCHLTKETKNRHAFDDVASNSNTCRLTLARTLLATS